MLKLSARNSTVCPSRTWKRQIPSWAAVGIVHNDVGILAPLDDKEVLETAMRVHAIDVDEKTLQEQHEPALIRAGYVVRTPQGRIATQLAYEFMGRSAK